MLNFHINTKFSKQHSDNRINKANESLGENVVTRILAFSLYLLGANLQEIAQSFNFQRVTIKAMVHRILEEGLPALEDRRQCRSTFLPPAQPTLKDPVLFLTSKKIIVELDNHHKIEIPCENKIQCQTVLLTLLDNKLLNLDDVAHALKLSTERTRKLKTALIKKDVPVLIDKRRGQQRDYRVTSELKAEMIQQFVLNTSMRVSTSSEQLSLDLRERCQIDLEPRTIRLHLAKLGLPEIRNTLPELLQTVKKTQKFGHHSS